MEREEKRMDELLLEKKEALTVMKEYLGKLIPGMEAAVYELTEGRKADTDTLLKNCIDGLNWVIEIYNRTSDVIQEKEVKLNKEEMNPTIQKLGNALAEKEDRQIADALQGVIPFLKTLESIA